MVDQERLRAYLRLHLAEGVGPITFHKMVEAFGGVEDVFAASPGQWKRVEGVGAGKSQGIGAVTDEQVDEELRLTDEHKVEILCCEEDGYPAGLKMIPDPPPILYVRGRLDPTDAVAVAVVGARRCTHYGLEQAERFGQLLGRAGFTVVSGGARGIDTAAHRGALAAGGRTIAVMGCGLAQLYPPENQKLFDRILREDRGAIVAELPMRTAVLAGNFPTRNRIISGLSLGVLIIEAARRSGSLITAREAAEQGKQVFALPGRADSPMSHGTNELIRDGATLVQNLDDVLAELGGVGRKVSEMETAERAALPAGLDETERALVEALEGGPLGLDELVRRTSVDTGRAASAMTMLVLKGLVAQQPGNVFARKKAPPRRP